MGELFLQIGSVLRLTGFALSPLLLLPLLYLIVPKALARPANSLANLLDRISSVTLFVAIGFAILMVLAQLLLIIARYVFDWSASWANEIIIYSFAGMFLLAAGSALKHDTHVRVDILREKMSTSTKAGIDLAGIYLFLFPICALILWSAISPSFVRSWLQFEGSRESDGLPIYFLFRTFVPLFAITLMIQGLSMAIRAAKAIRGRDTASKAEAS